MAARNHLKKSLEESRVAGDLVHERLQDFQLRLSSVTRAMAPIHEESKISTEVSSRIDKAIESIMALHKLDDVGRNLRKIIAGEPFLDLDGYLAALIQLQDAISFHRHESDAAVRSLQETLTFLETASTDSRRTERLRKILKDLRAEQTGGFFDGDLLGVALGKLEKEFKRLLSENCLPVPLPSKMGPQTVDAPFSSFELEYIFSFPSEVLQKMQAIIGRLAGTDQYQRCLDAYQESRSVQCRRSLEALNVEYLKYSTPELVEEVPWNDLQIMIERWTQQLEVAVKVLYAGERRLARQVFKEVGWPVWVECLHHLANPGMSAFLQFGESVSQSSRSPEKLCKLLEMMAGLEKSGHSVIQVFDGQACHGIRSRYRALLKQVCDGAFRTFWDMRIWVEEQKEPQTHDGSVMKLCSFVVNYLNYLVREFLPLMNKALRSRNGDEGHETDLAQGILLPLQALERQVEARAEEIPNPALRNLFLMNNYQYIYSRVDKSCLKDFLDDSWMFGIGRKVDKNTVKYRSDICRKMVVHLHHERLAGAPAGKSAARTLVRQRLKAFYSALDDTLRTQGNWTIQDENLRETTRLYVIENVVSPYRGFLESYGQLLQGHLSSSTKYVKYTPEMVEQLLTGLFSSRRQNSTSDGS